MKRSLIYLIMTMLVLPASVVIGMQKAPHAQAADGNVVKLVFTTSEQTIEAGEISEKITVQTQNIGNTEEEISSTAHLNLFSTSATGEFSSSDSSWADTTVLTMNSGWGNRSFYYRDVNPGIHTLTVAAQGEIWTPAQQNITVTAAPDTAAPVVFGVEDEHYYNTTRTVSVIDNVEIGSITLNGDAFTSGSAVSAEGNYALIATDVSGNSTTVNFTIDKTDPVISGISDGEITDEPCTINFSEGTASS